MQCPRCGAELEAGSIYCKKCGLELQIVPDYDPLDELLIGQTQVSKEAKKKEKLNTPPTREEKEEKDPAPVKRSILQSVPKIFWLMGLILLGFVAFLIAYFSMSKENNYSYQLRKGISLMEDEAYDEALPYLKKAQSLQAGMEGTDVDPLRYLSKAYVEIDYPEMAVACMQDAIRMEAEARGDHYELGDLYLEFMEILNQTHQTSLIPEIIETCEYEEIRQMLLPYRIEKPSSDTPEGEYGYYLKLELDAEYGSIYYTLDGTEPTIDSERYEGPISLEEGETLLSAVAINKKGMVSDKLVLVYKLNFDKNPIEESEEEL